MASRPIRFLLSGGSAAATEYFAFALLYSSLVPGHLVLSQTVSFLAGFVVSFGLNRIWVFNSKGRWWHDLLKYSVLAAVNLVLGNAMIWVLAGPASLPPLLAKLLVMCMIAIWNYVIFSRIVFRAVDDAVEN
ncbi:MULTISPECIES: GtrA family protein [Stenotrophomonas]|uniref:GtrA family protein n=1 Tax=Stenotrophomonas TaxID=40323 RepID=UPI0013C4EBC2|nr:MULTISPECIES: GtrA family protein [Stenotrophomonas]MCU1004896.1 GtrA family protein [Stenotrophomonas maltophilia]